MFIRVDSWSSFLHSFRLGRYQAGVARDRVVAAFDQFLQRARRNWTLWLIAEHAAIGLLCGCSCALLLLPILIWRGEPGLAVALILPLIAVFVGLMSGYRRRPALRDVAMRADVRFQTADLLATALAVRGSADPWHANILLMADACAAMLSPNLLTPHRLGARAWSGVLLALVGAITLGAMSATTPHDQTEAAITVTPPDAWSAIEQRNQPAADSQQNAASAAREARAETTPDSQKMGGDDAQQDVRSGTPSDRSPREGQAVAGTGAGSGRTDSAKSESPANHAATPVNESVSNGAIATGGGGSEMHQVAGAGERSGTVSAGPQAAVAPWSTAGWPAAQAAAANAMQSGRVPDAYRNLVRDYFDQCDRSAYP